MSAWPKMGEARVMEIVNETRAIRFWIQGRLDEGWTDEQIAALLPHATAFIQGKMSEIELRDILEQGLQRPVTQSPAYPKCDARRYGRLGVLRCPHGCVTECARDRQRSQS